MQNWHYDPMPDRNQPLSGRLRNFPRQPDIFVYSARLLAALYIRGWLRVYHRFRMRGREHLPQQRSYVLVANHASHLDTLCLLAALPLRQIHHAFPAAAQDYFFVSVPRLILTAVVTNALPFDRHIAPEHSLQLCRYLLEQPGNILLLFPEGTRTTTGALGRFKLGIGLIVAGTHHPVIPCYLHGPYAAWPKGAWCPKPRKIELCIGQPRVYAHLPPGKESAIQIAQELQDAVLALGPGAIPTSRAATDDEVL